MNEIKKLQGVPTQIEYLKPKGGRRHIAWCKYSEHKGNRRYMHMEESHILTDGVYR